MGERIYENDEASVTGRDQGRDEYLSQVMTYEAGSERRGQSKRGSFVKKYILS